MSELKVIKIELNNHGKPIASIQGTTSYYGISPNDTFYPQEETDKVIAELKAKVNGLKNLANLWHYNAQNEHNESVMVYMEKIKLKNRADKLLSCLKCLVMRDLIKDCPEKESAIEIVKEYKNVLG